MAPTLRGNRVPRRNPHASHQGVVQMAVHTNGQRVCGVPGKRDNQACLRTAQSPKFGQQGHVRKEVI